jgi:hypothetical protein
VVNDRAGKGVEEKREKVLGQNSVEEYQPSPAAGVCLAARTKQKEETIIIGSGRGWAGDCVVEGARWARVGVEER